MHRFALLTNVKILENRWIILFKAQNSKLDWCNHLGNVHKWRPTIFDDFWPPYLNTSLMDIPLTHKLHMSSQGGRVGVKTCPFHLVKRFQWKVAMGFTSNRIINFEYHKPWTPPFNPFFDTFLKPVFMVLHNHLKFTCNAFQFKTNKK